MAVAPAAMDRAAIARSIRASAYCYDAHADEDDQDSDTFPAYGRYGADSAAYLAQKEVASHGADGADRGYVSRTYAVEDGDGAYGYNNADADDAYAEKGGDGAYGYGNADADVKYAEQIGDGGYGYGNADADSAYAKKDGDGTGGGVGRRAEGQGALHTRFSCDGCNASFIVGTRYSCRRCDVDVCHQCVHAAVPVSAFSFCRHRLNLYPFHLSLVSLK